MASKRQTPPAAGRRRLGRGLDSLLRTPVSIDASDAEQASASGDQHAEHVPPPESQAAEAADRNAATADRIQFLAVDSIDVNPHQPRQAFDETALDELAASIRSAGLMQPIVVRPGAGGRHELIAGERRWRAVRRLELSEIPAVVRDVDDRTAAEWALVENLQREDLNPMERAEAFGRLRDQFGLTHQDIADRVGLNRSTVNNIIRLNDLEDDIKSAIRRGKLSLGHAKALLAITNSRQRVRLARRAADDGWSVRAVERAAAEANGPQQQKGPSVAPPGATDDLSARTAHLRDLETTLSRHLGTRVQIRAGRKKGTGTLMVDFYSLEQFEGLLSRLDVPAEMQT